VLKDHQPPLDQRLLELMLKSHRQYYRGWNWTRVIEMGSTRREGGRWRLAGVAIVRRVATATEALAPHHGG